MSLLPWVPMFRARLSICASRCVPGSVHITSACVPVHGCACMCVHSCECACAGLSPHGSVCATRLPTPVWRCVQAGLPSAPGRWEEGEGQAEALGNLCNKSGDSTWWLEHVCTSRPPSQSPSQLNTSGGISTPLGATDTSGQEDTRHGATSQG